MIDEDDITLDELLLLIVKKMEETNLKLDQTNNILDKFLDEDIDKQVDNDNLRTVLKDVIKYMATINETYINIPTFLNGISQMFSESTLQQAEISELLHVIKDKNKTIKHNMPSREASYLSLAQQELGEAMAQLISSAVDVPYELVFQQMVNWGIEVRSTGIDIKSEINKDERKPFWWAKFLLWASKQFELPVVTTAVLQGMYTVFNSEVTGDRIVEKELMQTLLKLQTEALLQGEENDQ